MLKLVYLYIDFLTRFFKQLIYAFIWHLCRPFPVVDCVVRLHVVVRAIPADRNSRGICLAAVYAIPTTAFCTITAQYAAFEIFAGEIAAIYTRPGPQMPAMLWHLANCKCVRFFRRQSFCRLQSPYHPHLHRQVFYLLRFAAKYRDRCC